MLNRTLVQFKKPIETISTKQVNLFLKQEINEPFKRKESDSMRNLAVSGLHHNHKSEKIFLIKRRLFLEREKLFMNNSKKSQSKLQRANKFILNFNFF